MTTYMGPSLGAMVPVRCASSLAVDATTRTDVAVNMAGLRRVYVDAQSVPALRTWSLSVNPVDPSTMATLYELESLRVGLRMVTDEAAMNNVLPPGAATGPAGWLASTGRLDRGDLMVLEDPYGVAASSGDVSSGFANVFSPLFPVVPGVPVSATIHLLANAGASARVALDWMSPTAGQGAGALSTPDSESTTVSAGGAPRLRVGATPPAGVVAARLRLTDTARFARAAVTWTAATRPFRPGEGAEVVHLSPLVHEVSMATLDRSLASYSFTATEVSA